MSHATSQPPPAPPKPPPPTVRGEAFFVRVDRALHAMDGWFARWLPEELNPLAQSGRAANLAIVVAVVSGILMLFWYSPSIQYAHSSLAAIEGRTLGGWVRAMHRYSSDLIMLLLFVHAGRMLFARKFSGARWLPWVSGIFLIALMWFIGWTGFWLVWDQPAQQIAITSVRFLDILPVFGEPMSRLFVVDRLVPSLLFFVVFFLHMLLPLLIAVGLVFHLARVTRVRLLPGRGLTCALLAALAIGSLLVPAPLDEAANMTVKPEQLTVDAWYLTPLALALRLGDGALWLIVGLSLAFVTGIPWLLGRRLPRIAPAEEEETVDPPLTARSAPSPILTFVNETRCHACTQCVQDCPYGAVSMVPRTDGKAFAARALVDPDRCVGCAVCVGSCDSEAMDLPWFSIGSEESAILASVGEATVEGKAPPVALVGGDIDGGLSFLRRSFWEQRLPGYQVHFVPTAAYVRPKFVERLLKAGAGGVLIVRDSRAEAAARDGNLWPEDRLAGKREPAFRPNRAKGRSDWRVLAYDAANAAAFSAEARAFREGDRGTNASPPSGGGPILRYGAIAAFIALLMTAVIGPSNLQVTNPAPSHPEFVLSFKAFGEVEDPAVLDEEADASRPVHMRGRPTGKPTRLPVEIHIRIDEETHTRAFRAKGISRDGPAIGEWRLPLEAGQTYQLHITIDPGPATEAFEWTHTFTAESRRLHVLTYDPGEGFLFHAP